ncbi:MAG: hypothetical protein ACLT2T_15945 [Bilophila wadsworthia]
MMLKTVLPCPRCPASAACKLGGRTDVSLPPVPTTPERSSPLTALSAFRR